MSVFKIIGLILIAMAATSPAEEFIVRHRQPVQKLELIVSNPVGSVAGCPLDASVIVTASDDKHTFGGSGTCIASHDGVATIITCNHTFRGLVNPAIYVTSEGTKHFAKLVKADDSSDLAVLEVATDLPYVDLSPVKPGVHDTVTSVGIDPKADTTLVEWSHTITAVDKYNNPRNFETDGQQQPGRSGGGLFFNGNLCGIIQAKRNDVSRSIYVSIEPIREILNRSTVGSSQKTEVTLWMAPFFCQPCNRLNRLLGDGNDSVSVTRRVAPANWQPSEGGFPFVEFATNDGKTHLLYGIESLEHLERNIAKLEGDNASVESADSGAKLSGKPIVETFLNGMQSYFGPDATFSLKIHREGGKDAFLMGQPFTKEDLVGTSGTISVEITSTKKLPVNKFSFKYRFVDGKPYIDPDEIAINLSDDGTVGAGQPVGNPIMIAWTIISTIDTTWRIFHPSVSLYLGPDIELFGKLENNGLTVDVRSNISVKLGWSFWMGLLKFEYSRALTGAILHPDNLGVQFHKSRLYRDVNIPVQ